MQITQYHAHVYFLPSQLNLARQLHQRAQAELDLPVGRLHQQAIGPHPRPMFQMSIAASKLAEVLPWLMTQRQALSVLLHPVSGNDLLDHSQHVAWLGEPLALRLDALAA